MSTQAHNPELPAQDKPAGKWILELEDGTFYVGDTPDEALRQVPEGARIKDLYRNPKEGELLLY